MSKKYKKKTQKTNKMRGAITLEDEKSHSASNSYPNSMRYVLLALYNSRCAKMIKKTRSKTSQSITVTEIPRLGIFLIFQRKSSKKYFTSSNNSRNLAKICINLWPINLLHFSTLFRLIVRMLTSTLGLLTSAVTLLLLVFDNHLL